MSTRIPLHVVEFAAKTNTTDLINAFVDYSNHYKAEILKKPAVYDNSVSFAEKTEKLHNSIDKEISRLSGVAENNFAAEVNRLNPNHNWATFAVIGAMIDAVLPDSVISTFDRFAEVRVGGFGDTFSFDIKPNSLFLITKAGNGRRHTFAQRQFNGQATLVPENRMITVAEDLYRILAGKRNLAEYANKIALSFEETIALDIYNAINDTYSALPATFKEASFTQDTFVTLAQRVTTFNGGAKCSVFGTQLALSKVIPTNEYFKMQLGEEYTKTGFLGNFMNTSLFECRQAADWTSSTYAMKLDDTRLYFVSGGVDKLVKIGIEGAAMSFTNNTFDNATLTQKQTMMKRWAVALISGAHFGILDLS